MASAGRSCQGPLASQIASEVALDLRRSNVWGSGPAAIYSRGAQAKIGDARARVESAQGADVRVDCPSCGQRLEIPGRAATCPNCGTLVTIPTAAAQQQPQGLAEPIREVEHPARYQPSQAEPLMAPWLKSTIIIVAAFALIF